MKAYKAFGSDFSCRGFKYAIGQTYKHAGAVRLCGSGFHACESPLDVLRYYPPTARFAEVTLGNVSDEQEADSKRAAGEITIEREITLSELIAAQVSHVKATGGGQIASGDYSKAASSGNDSNAASSGNDSNAASSGYRSTAASSGSRSTAASSGYRSTAASSGDCSTAASSGDYSKAASSGNDSNAASSGDYSTAASSGDYSTAASSGDYSTAASSGERTIAMVAGLHGRAKAGIQGAFALPWLDGDQVRIAVGIIGANGIKPDTWYCVGDAGQLIETEE